MADLETIPAVSEWHHLRYFTPACCLIVGFGVVFLIYTFFIPRNLIADETDYLTQVVSIARGTPDGWEIRSVVYPVLIAPFVRLAETLFGPAPSVGMLAARAANLGVAGLSLLAVFLAGRRIGGTLIGLVALIFALFPWAWIWAAGRFMMDVPAGTWLALAILPLLRNKTRPLDTILLVAFGSLAVFTKFQMGPTVLAAGLWHIAAQPDGTSRWRTAVLAAATAAIMVGGYCLTEYAVHGAPFHSAMEFLRYNFLTGMTDYGPCQPVTAYLTQTPLVFSYLLPILFVAGIAFAFLDRSRVAAVAVVAIVYLASLQLFCHKEPRYLIAVSPLVALLASYGAIRLLSVTARWQWIGAVLGKRKEAVLSGAFALGMLATVASLLPRGELPMLLADQEDCPSFVFASLDHLASAAGDRPFALVHPCYVPTVYLRGYSVAFEDLAAYAHSPELALRKFRERVTGYGALLLESGSERERILTDEFAGTFVLSRRSPMGEYAIYAARQTP